MLPPRLATTLHRTASLTVIFAIQLYLVLYVGLVPLNEKVQKEIIPVVCFVSLTLPTFRYEHRRKSDLNSTIAPLLPPDILRMLPPWSVGSGDSHVQRCP